MEAEIPSEADNASSITSYGHLSTKQEVAVLVVGWVTVALSILGSSIIMFLLIKTGKWKSELYHRLVAGLTIMDIITSVSGVFTPFALPKETGNLHASGNFATCSWAGFFFHFYLGGALYNAFLSFYYCLMITYGWKEKRIKKWMEPWVHLIAFGAPLIINSTAVARDMINPDPLTGICAFDPYPHDCLKADDVECTRGSKDSPLSTIMSVMYLFAVTGGIYFTLRVYSSVRKRSRRSFRFSITGQTDSREERRIKAVGSQALLYSAAFLNGFVSILLYYVMTAVFGSDINRPGVFPTILILYLLFPIQGFWNFLVYIRPRLIQWKQTNPDQTWFWVFGKVMSGQQAPRSATGSRTWSSRPLHAGTSAFEVGTSSWISKVPLREESSATPPPEGTAETADDEQTSEEQTKAVHQEES